MTDTAPPEPTIPVGLARDLMDQAVQGLVTSAQVAHELGGILREAQQRGEESDSKTAERLDQVGDQLDDILGEMRAHRESTDAFVEVLGRFVERLAVQQELEREARTRAEKAADRRANFWSNVIGRNAAEQLTRVVLAILGAGGIAKVAADNGLIGGP